MKTEKLISDIKEIASDLSITSEINWESSNGGRCITDYQTEISFSRLLTADELSAVKSLFRNTDGCPGWTPVSGYLCNEEKLLYRFSTCWDSSD